MNFTLKSIFAGILISIGAFTYVSTGCQIIGAILFAFGLISVVCTQSNLFTGKSGFCETKEDYKKLIYIILFNVIGCFLVAFFASDVINVDNIINKRISTNFSTIFLLSILTGVIMTISVKYAKYDKNFLPLLFGVPTFIICGMPHCIADAFYYGVYFYQGKFENIFPIWGLSIIGNFIGCVIPTKLIKI